MRCSLMSWLTGAGRRESAYLIGFVVAGGILLSLGTPSATEQKVPQTNGYAGTTSCRSCHEKFYQLWAPSHHGLAMQPYNESFAEKNLKIQDEVIVIGSYRYRAIIDEGPGFVRETGPNGQKKYPILHAMGGKNVYYFLTELERGYLQVLPVAFDVNRQTWFDTAASGIRHFPDREEDSPFNWKDRPYTFNSSCYGCHVSQLVKNYDPKTDTYNTQWKEPGINCEACHGPAEEHVRVCVEAGHDNVPDDLKIVTVTQDRDYTAHQVNTACLSCHSKAVPITAEFVPGEDFFQHYDLVTLEHPDYYPNGRDLGENYTHTSWMMSPCVNASELDCMYCHTSSGRYRFKGKTANDACVKCHTEKSNIQKHSNHKTYSGVTKCIQCHMPKTEFGRMVRSDHSMQPPTPASTARLKSPNACNMCHKNKEPKWADKHIRKWHGSDYQKSSLQMAELIDQARKNDWKNLSAMLKVIQDKNRDTVFANSLVRLMQNCDDDRIGPVLTELLEKDPSPLIRASAADTLGQRLQPNMIDVLANATSDPYRLVRIRAAAALSVVPSERIPSKHKITVQRATQEFIVSMNSRPDDASSHYNLANFYRDKQELDKAIDSYKFATFLDNDFLLPHVNASLVYNQMGRNEQALKSLKQALNIDPENIPANLNLALLYGEMAQYDKAEAAFRKTIKLDPRSAVAAYNLSILLAEKNPGESIIFGRKAVQLQPDNDRYTYTLGFYLNRAGRNQEVITLLEPFVNKNTIEMNIYLLLGNIYEQMDSRTEAIRVYQTGAENEKLPEQARAVFFSHLQRLSIQ